MHLVALVISSLPFPVSDFRGADRQDRGIAGVGYCVVENHAVPQCQFVFGVLAVSNKANAWTSDLLWGS